MISEMPKRISASITLAITAKAKALKAEGKNVIGFGAGEPDFDTPEFIKDAAIAALKEGATKYTPAIGTPQLKQAVIEKFKRENGLEYNMPEIMINCGAKHTLFNIIMCTAGKGDEVLIPSPYWVSYPEMVKAAGAEPVIIDCLSSSDFKLTPQLLEENINEKTRLLILNSPSNPTGTLYSESELRDLGEIVLKNNIFVISDEIYEHLVYDNEFCSIAQISPELKEKTVVVNGVSKAYSMTGWRIGYGAGNAEIIKACSKLQSHSTSNPTTFAQAGAVAALNSPESYEEIKKMKSAFEERRIFMYEYLSSIDGVTINKPGGAFYAFPNISGCFNDKVSSSFQFAEKILEEKLVALVPGEGFGAPGFIRLSYAASMDDIKEGLNRIKEFISELK